MTASALGKGYWTMFPAAGVATGVWSILEISSGISKSQLLEVAKQINSTCCFNITAQPTALCQAQFAAPIKLDKSFMNFICQFAEESCEKLPATITSNITFASITGGIAVVSLLTLAGYGAYHLYKHCKHRDYEELS